MDFVSPQQMHDFAWGWVCAMFGFGVGLLTADALRMDYRRWRRHQRRVARRRSSPTPGAPSSR